jgi:hypothetical protein
MSIINKNNKDKIMYQLVIITLSILFSSFALAKSSYQIDLIIFANPQTSHRGLDLNSPLIAKTRNVIVLKNANNKSFAPYNLLPPSQSNLRDEQYLLSRKSHYQVLGYYTWRQPSNNKNTVSLPELNFKGWQMQGTLLVKKDKFYTLNADLQFSPPSNPNATFTVTQKQRLKENVVYYLDHDYIGLLVKIHEVA